MGFEADMKLKDALGELVAPEIGICIDFHAIPALMKVYVPRPKDRVLQAIDMVGKLDLRIRPDAPVRGTMTLLNKDGEQSTTLGVVVFEKPEGWPVRKGGG